MASHLEAQMSRFRDEEAEKEVYLLKNKIEIGKSEHFVREAELKREHASKVSPAHKHGMREASLVYQDCSIQIAANLAEMGSARCTYASVGVLSAF